MSAFMKNLQLLLVSLLCSLNFSGNAHGRPAHNFSFEGVVIAPVPEKICRTGRNLHPPPGIIGNIPSETGADTLMLSHFMARSLKNVEESLSLIRSSDDGSLSSFDELDRMNLWKLLSEGDSILARKQAK